MALLTKIIKNRSGSDLDILGTLVADNDEISVSPQKFLKLADESSELHDLISSGDIIINNGIEDLSPTDGLNYAKTISPDDAASISFNEDGWDATNVADAILEAPSKSGSSGAIISTTFIRNGSAQNKWLDNNCRNVNSNETFYIVPFNCKLIAITFSNSRQSVECDIELYRSTQNSGVSDKTKILTWQVRNTRCGNNSNYSIDLNIGDKLAVFLKDQGTNPHDPVVDIYLQITDLTLNTNTENFSGDF